MATRCCYGITYADKSSSAGFLAKDKFTLTSSDVFDGIHFGCGEQYNKIPDDTDGLLGLSRHDHSFPSQTAKTYNNIFSYCLPSSASYTGHLTFGSAGISESVKYTPIISVPKWPDLYGLDIVGITVGGKKLEIPTTVFSEPGAIIDSGTVITRLPPKAYSALRSEFKKQMKNYKTTSRVVDKLMDTCYHSTGFDTMTIPKISFSFAGGTTVELDSKGILYQINNGSHVCLAFAGNENDSQVAIFGSVQQMTLQVVYDNAGGRVGFAPNGCS